MQKVMNTIESKLGDHPNVSADPGVNPDKGIGKGANEGNGKPLSIPLLRRFETWCTLASQSRKHFESCSNLHSIDLD